MDFFCKDKYLTKQLLICPLKSFGRQVYLLLLYGVIIISGSVSMLAVVMSYKWDQGGGRDDCFWIWCFHSGGSE
jgi:hypothetical protein